MYLCKGFQALKNPSHIQTFKKPERLRSKKLIDRLFNQGSTYFSYPFKILWIYTDSNSKYPVQVLIGSSRRTLRRAVDRNKMKRRIREAYRKNKNILFDSLNRTNRHCALAIIHTGKEITKYKETERKIIAVLERLIEDNEAYGPDPEKLSRTMD